VAVVTGHSTDRLRRWALPGVPAAEQRHTSYHATDTTITIGIRGPDAQQRINQLRNALTKLITQNPWTTREQPR
jgi:hypothetical protein